MDIHHAASLGIFLPPWRSIDRLRIACASLGHPLGPDCVLVGTVEQVGDWLLAGHVSSETLSKGEMRLVTFGVGYVGLVTGTGLAELGHDVLCVDIDPQRVRQLKDGIIPIYEPGLTDLVRRNERAGRLSFALEVSPAFAEADAYFIAVGTPAGADGAADISSVLDAADRIARTAKRPALVVVKSTVPVGTCDAVQARIDGQASVPLEVVSNPEFLKEGSAVEDFFRPDRIVLGARSEQAREAMRALYAPLQLSGERVVVTDPRSSELTKYAANTMLAMRVSFMNELSRLCHATGADVHAVRLGVGSDMRIGKRFLYAGPGYGGSCFPKDVKALMHLGRTHGVPMRLAEATQIANEEQTAFVGTSSSGPSAFCAERPSPSGVSHSSRRRTTFETPPPLNSPKPSSPRRTHRGHDPEAGRNLSAKRRTTGERAASWTVTTTPSTAPTPSFSSPSGAATAPRTSRRFVSASRIPARGETRSSSMRATFGALPRSFARGCAIKVSASRTYQPPPRERPSLGSGERHRCGESSLLVASVSSDTMRHTRSHAVTTSSSSTISRTPPTRGQRSSAMPKIFEESSRIRGSSKLV